MIKKVFICNASIFHCGRRILSIKISWNGILYVALLSLFTIVAVYLHFL